jgi:hypothetical protein
VFVVKLTGAAAAAAVKAQKQHLAAAAAAGAQHGAKAAAKAGAGAKAVGDVARSADIRAAFVSELRQRVAEWDVAGGTSCGQQDGCQGGKVDGGSGSGGIGSKGGVGCGGCGGGGCGGGHAAAAGAVGSVSGDWGMSRMCRKLLSSSMAWPLGFA